MTIYEMIVAIAKDAYEGATEQDLERVFTLVVEGDLHTKSDDEIKKIYAEIIGG